MGWLASGSAMPRKNTFFSKQLANSEKSRYLVLSERRDVNFPKEPMPTSELYSYVSPESDEVLIYRARVRALLILEPNLGASDIFGSLSSLYGPKAWLPINWLEYAAEEKQKLYAAKLAGYADAAMSATRNAR